MADTPKTAASTVVLDRTEWESLVDEVGKLTTAHDRLLKDRNNKEKQISSLLKKAKVGPGKRSLMSRIRGFFGQEPIAASSARLDRFCSYCGADAQFSDRFCRICGKDIQIQTGPTETQSMQTDSSVGRTGNQREISQSNLRS